jgi:hypothetical protein
MNSRTEAFRPERSSPEIQEVSEALREVARRMAAESDEEKRRDLLVQADRLVKHKGRLAAALEGDDA